MSDRVVLLRCSRCDREYRAASTDATTSEEANGRVEGLRSEHDAACVGTLERVDVVGERY